MGMILLEGATFRKDTGSIFRVFGFVIYFFFFKVIRNKLFCIVKFSEIFYSNLCHVYSKILCNI